MDPQPLTQRPACCRPQVLEGPVAVVTASDSVDRAQHPGLFLPPSPSESRAQIQPGASLLGRKERTGSTSAYGCGPSGDAGAAAGGEASELEAYPVLQQAVWQARRRRRDEETHGCGSSCPRW